jgi:predicted amidohydrolase
MEFNLDDCVTIVGGILPEAIGKEGKVISKYGASIYIVSFDGKVAAFYGKELRKAAGEHTVTSPHPSLM